MSRTWTVFSLESFVPTWYASLGYPASFYGPLATTVVLASAAGTIGCGTLADRYGRKAVIIGAPVLAGASMIMFPYAPSYAWFLLACVAWSVASGISGAAPAAYAADVAPPGMNAAAMSTYRMLGDVGYMLGPLALGLVADLFGLETALATAAVLLAAVGLTFARRAPETWR